MRRRPPLRALSVFETAARNGSFLAAAKELHVSQAAISQKVRELEVWIGGELVARRRPVVVVTEGGLKVADSIRSGVTTITRSLDQAKRRSERKTRVSLATTNTFALYWLGARIESFYSAHPDVELSLITSDREATESQDEFDLAVTFAGTAPDGYTSELLFHTDVVAVASPKYVAQRPEGLEPAQWRRDMLLHLSPDRSMDWPEWLGMVDPPQRHQLRASYHSNYITLIQAATAGRGIGLGWRQLIDPLLQSGELAQIGERKATSSGAYYLIRNGPMSYSSEDAVGALTEWFLDRIDP